MQGQKTPIAQIAIGRAAAGEPLRVTLALLPDLSFPGSAQVVGDCNGPVLDLPWRRCLPGTITYSRNRPKARQVLFVG